MTEVTAVEVVSASNSNKPSNGETLISLVLDETGSMMSCYDSTISSVNDYLGSQKSAPGVAKVNLYTFSSNGLYGRAGVRTFNATYNTSVKADEPIRTIVENTAIADVEFLTKQNYRPNGGTNLYDAIGTTIRRVEDQLSPMESVPNVLIVIVTDGGENTSSEYNLASVKALIQEKEAQGWTFVYLGANQDAWNVAQSFGLAKGQAMTYSTDNMAATMATLNEATVSYRGLRATGAVANGSVTKDFFGGDGK
jgi:hypothetical protein